MKSLNLTKQNENTFISTKIVVGACANQFMVIVTLRATDKSGVTHVMPKEPKYMPIEKYDSLIEWHKNEGFKEI